MNQITLGEFPAHLFGPQQKVEEQQPGVLVFHDSKGSFIRRLPRTRYTLTEEVRRSFSREQIYAQERRLKETGRWIIPNGGEEFTLRIELPSDYPEKPNPSSLVPLLPDQEYLTADKVQNFMDLDIIHVTDEDGTVHPEYKAFSNSRRQYHDLTTETKIYILENDTNKGILWWEKGDWLCHMRHRVLDEDELHLSSHFYAMLVIALLDRVVNKVEATSHRAKSNKLTRAGLNKQQPDEDGIQRITLYCPGHFSHANGEHGLEKAHGTPKRMHYRAEHVKMQPHGPRNSLRKLITVEALWVNAEDVDPSELGTPIRHIKLVGG